MENAHKLSSGHQSLSLAGNSNMRNELGMRWTIVGVILPEVVTRLVITWHVFCLAGIPIVKWSNPSSTITLSLSDLSNIDSQL